MTNSTDTHSSLPKNCIAVEDSNCAECEIEGELICFVERKFANKFMLGNILYRILAVSIFIFSGLMIGHWWMLISYSVVLLVTFTIIEPRLLCSHCPFYEIEGRFLKCWALRGMPKLWKYRPEPISRNERLIMLVLGSFIDLFPFVGAVWGIIFYALNYTEYIFEGVFIIILTLLFMIIAGYFSRVLLGNKCKRCANFSCSMNKVPKELIDTFLKKNPKMKNAWVACGWETAQE